MNRIVAIILKIYQIISLYTLYIYNFSCQLYLNKSGGKNSLVSLLAGKLKVMDY